MGAFTAGMVAGCVLGVCGTFLMLSLGTAFSAEHARLFRLRPLPGALLSVMVLLCMAAFCHRMSIGKDASMLLLLLIVLVISKLEGVLNGLVATSITALILVFGFFPPAASVLIRSSSDNLALALFLLIATLGSCLLGRRLSSSSQSFPRPVAVKPPAERDFLHRVFLASRAKDYDRVRQAKK